MRHANLISFAFAPVRFCLCLIFRIRPATVQGAR
jgi:hypothetical protein